MDIKRLIHEINVSTLLILPTIKNNTKKAKLKNSNIEIPVIQLLLENGLINSFLYTDKDRTGKNLYLLFDRHKLQKRFKLTNHPSFSAVEYILGLPNLDKNKPLHYMSNDFICYKINLDSALEADINLIKESKYSHVSDEYKQLIRNKNDEVVVTKNELAKDIVKYNVPYSITRKSSYYVKLFEKWYKTKVDKNNEVFKSFKVSDEIFSEKTIRKLIKKWTTLTAF